MASSNIIVISYFAPFAGRKRNASRQVAYDLAKQLRRSKHRVQLIELPVIYDLCAIVLMKKAYKKAALILSLGEAPTSTCRLELLAYNRDHTPKLADNAGTIRRSRVIVPKAPPRRRLLRLKKSPSLKKIKDLIYSRSAGRFVCNNLCFHMAARHRHFVFVHVPNLEVRNRRPYSVYAKWLANLIEYNYPILTSLETTGSYV